jgi:hypothetical protein
VKGYDRNESAAEQARTGCLCGRYEGSGIFDALFTPDEGSVRAVAATIGS